MFDWNELQKLLPTREDLFLLIDDIFHDEIINKGLGLLLHQACDLIFQEDFNLLFSISTEIIDFTWEILNTGHWKNVKLSFCKTFYLGSFFKAISMIKLEKSLEEIFQICDMGLLMGMPVFDDILNKLLELLKPQKNIDKLEDLNRSNIVLNKEKTSTSPSDAILQNVLTIDQVINEVILHNINFLIRFQS